MARTSALRSESRLLSIIAGAVVVACLYFARVVFIPLALALLFSVLLTPVILLLEKIKLPRLLAICLVVVSFVSLIGVGVWKTSQQFIYMTDQLPEYRANLDDKIRALSNSRSRSLNKAAASVENLTKEAAAAVPGSPPKKEAGKKNATPGSSPSQPLAVQVVTPVNPLESATNWLGPLATALMVIVFTTFMLLGREDLRNRFIRLAGGGHLTIMTQALDEATNRIHRYLLLQSAVNAGYGLVIGFALYLIGIPNAWFLGVVAAILRFLPYVGAPLAALAPIGLSLAVFPGWFHGAATICLFLVLELVVANFIEPRLYGAHVGLSPIAILVAAVFWTLIWGVPGLILSTPLTVCLVVMGRYVPTLGFLSVVLGDEEVLSPESQYYQRLLATDQHEARQILELYLKEKPLEELYSSVVIPALRLAEQDRHSNKLDEDRQNFIYQSTREIVEEFGEIPSETATDAAVPGDSVMPPRRGNQGTDGLDVLCIPARDAADDVVGLILCQLLERQGHSARSIAIDTTAEMLSEVSDAKPRVVCISALPPFALEHAKALYRKLRFRFPDLQVVVCLWQFEGDAQKAAFRFNLNSGDTFFTTLQQVLQDLACRLRSHNGMSGAEHPEAIGSG